MASLTSTVEIKIEKESKELIESLIKKLERLNELLEKNEIDLRHIGNTPNG